MGVGKPWAAAVLVLLLAGCATSTPRVLHYEVVAAANTVWPGPPDIPRYRFVGQLTGEDNFALPGDKRENAGVRFLRWVVGLGAGHVDPNILQRPQGGMVDAQGRIYVTDVSRQAVCVFDTVTGKFQVLTSATPAEPFLSPIAIAPGANGELLVTDSKLKLVARLRADGTPVAPIGRGLLGHPTGIARDGARGRIYVADTHNHDIKVFDDDGNWVVTVGSKGEAPGQFNSPTYLAFSNDTLVVSDTLNSRIQLLGPGGEPRATFGERGVFVGNMPRPKGVAVDQSGLIYVVESFFDHLLVFDSKGEFLLPIGGTGQGPGQFYLPAGVWADNNKRIYVADMFNGRVVVFEYLGEGA